MCPFGHGQIHTSFQAGGITRVLDAVELRGGHRLAARIEVTKTATGADPPDAGPRDVAAP